MKTFHLHIGGQVQGVGFRPYVYVKSVELKVDGWVKNTIDGVHIHFNSPDLEKAKAYSRAIIQNAPRLSIITDHHLEEIPYEAFDSFSIIHSEEKGKANLLITPDFAMCDDCRTELLDPTNRRVNYPFITCTNCGPRYSIITKLPYDRPYTTMKSFTMCSQCDEEYNDPANRRYFSQTNSCPDCAIRLSVFRANGVEVPIERVEQQIDFITEKLEEGAILAIKGIGGFLLIGDARHKKMVWKLRSRKHRPTKAFAMMFPDLDSIRDQLHLGKEEAEELTSQVSPIVLLRKRKDVSGKYAYDEIAPGLDRIGVMIPYTPLYALILQKFGHAILATSGNLTNEPIVYDNQQAKQKLGHIADYIVVNDRDIVVPQDDSVITYTSKYRQPVIYRRSRGMAPGFLDDKISWPDTTILATGGELKSSFSFLYNKRCYISQYLGDLEDFETQRAFRLTLDHFTGLFDAEPDIVLHDKHPLYFSTNLAEDLAQKFSLSKHAIQHHEAHFAAIMGEKWLVEEESVLGLIWDGTGYGNDGHIWGGEVFLCKESRIQRVAQLGYFDFILGDKMPKEPRISALSVVSGIEGYEDELHAKFNPTEWRIYQVLLRDESSLKTSSMGRLFDAAASIILEVDKVSYEGEAAMYLEVAARRYFDQQDSKVFCPLELNFSDSLNLDPFKLIRKLLEQKKEKLGKDKLAFKFHCTLVAWAKHLVKNLKIEQVACSGGVFQNTLLVDLMIMQLGDSCQLHFHEKMSPNDECISFGQMMYHVLQLKSN